MKDAKEFWDKSAPRYAKSSIKNEQAYQKKLAITQEYFQPDWSVLEFGCGTGSTAIIHAPHVKHILATDISDKMLDVAEQKARDADIENISFQQGTLDSLGLKTESLDAVLGLNVLHLLEDPEGAIKKINRLLKAGGIFISSTALTADINILWRLLIRIMQRLHLAPYVNHFNKNKLVSMLTNANFSIVQEWQPEKESIFIVAKKGA